MMRGRPSLARRQFLGLVAAGAAGACGVRRPEPSRVPAAGEARADVVVRGGSIMTLWNERPVVEAVALGGGVVLGGGSEREISAWVGPKTQVIDLGGGLATPGLTDAHAHLVGLGRTLEEVDLRGATSIADVVARLKAGDPGGAWLTGRGWDQNLWPGGAMPTREALDVAFPGRPVWLRRVDGHAGWASRAALVQSGVGKDASSPPGGEILRGEDGFPQGVLIDAAMGLMKLPSPTDQDVRRWILAAQAHALARGITGVHEMGISPLEDAQYRALPTQGGEALSMRITAYANAAWFASGMGRAPDVPTRDEGRYALVGVKLYADGALGSRGAALLAPYSDRHDHTGLFQYSPAQLTEMATTAMADGWQAATHAIGDAAIRTILDAYEAAAAAHPRPDHRFRVEHCQVIAVADIPRFAELGIVASMQPTHATSDMAWVPARVGPERLAGAYAWRRFLDAGVPLCFGSDFPVERVDIAHGLYAAVTRQDPNGQPAGGWLPDQRLDLEEAIAAFSASAAYAAHREDHLGILAPGMAGDVTCFSEDLRHVKPRAIYDAEVTATIVGGAVAYRAP